MTWFRVDDNLDDHPKTLRAGNAAMGLWVRCGAWSSRHLTDGHIPAVIAKAKGTPKEIAALVDAGFWRVVDDGWQMHDWLDRNPSSEVVKAERAAAAERMRTVRANKSRTFGRTEGERSGEVRKMFGDPCPTRPEPDPTPVINPPTNPPSAVAAEGSVGRSVDPYREVITLAVDVEQSRERHPITKPEGWRRVVMERIERQHKEAIVAALAAGATVHQAAAQALGITEFDIARIRIRGGYA